MSYEPGVYYPSKPDKITFAHNGIWGIHSKDTYAHNLWGISAHSLNKGGAGRWVKTGTIGATDDIQIVTGIAVQDWRVFISSPVCGLASWGVTPEGGIIPGSEKTIGSDHNEDRPTDLRIYKNELYVLCSEGISGNQFKGIKVFDLNFNLVRKFSISSSIFWGAETITVRNDLIYIHGGLNASPTYVYSVEGEFVKTMDFGIGNVNTIN